MSGIISELLTIAKKVNNYEIDPVGGVKVLWTSTTEFKAVVPAGRRWFLLGGVVNINVSSTLTIDLMNAADEMIDRIITGTATAGIVPYPSTNAGITYQGNAGGLKVLDAGEYVLMTFGTAQDAGSEASCPVLEIERT